MLATSWVDPLVYISIFWLQLFSDHYQDSPQVASTKLASPHIPTSIDSQLHQSSPTPPALPGIPSKNNERRVNSSPITATREARLLNDSGHRDLATIEHRVRGCLSYPLRVSSTTDTITISIRRTWFNRSRQAVHIKSSYLAQLIYWIPRRCPTELIVIYKCLICTSMFSFMHTTTLIGGKDTTANTVPIGFICRTIRPVTVMHRARRR